MDLLIIKKDKDVIITNQIGGIYHISGIVNIPSQVIVTSELDKELHASLRILTKKAREEDVENFLRMARAFTQSRDRHNADAILQLSVSANREIYEIIKRRDPTICEALRDLMKEEIQEERQEAVDIALIAAIKSTMESLGLDATKAMNIMNISERDQIRYAAKL
jgi:hypothetical protein